MKRVLSLLLIAVALTGCPPPAPEQVAQVFTFNNGAEPETLDLHLMTGVPENRLATALFEGLVGEDPKTLEPIPGVAESWTVSPDKLTYTFKLRQNAKWSDGQPVTAKDFRDSWERALTPATGCQYDYMLFPVLNAEQFRKGEVKDFSQVGVKAVDDHTLEVKLRWPCAYFLHLIAFKTLYAVRVDVIKKHGAKWSLPENMVCNGPFKLVEWTANQRIVMVKNEHYWGADKVRLEKVISLPIEDTETAYKLFREGKIDWMNPVPTPKVDEAKRLPEYYSVPVYTSYFYRLNVTKPPLDKVQVRRALAMGFDRSIITRDILKAGQTPTGALCPKMPGYEPPAGLGYDRDKARALLAEAGYPNGEGFPPIALLYNTSEAHKLVAENLVRQWKENLGITVSLRNSEWKVYLTDVEKLNYDIGRAAWNADYQDPNTFLNMFVTGGGNNSTGWSNAEYDRLIVAADKEGDPAQRAALLRQAETLLVEDEVPIIPVYIYVNQGLLSRKVRGWTDNPLDSHPFHYLWMEAAK